MRRKGDDGFALVIFMDAKIRKCFDDGNICIVGILILRILFIFLHVKTDFYEHQTNIKRK